MCIRERAGRDLGVRRAHDGPRARQGESGERKNEEARAHKRYPTIRAPASGSVASAFFTIRMPQRSRNG